MIFAVLQVRLLEGASAMSMIADGEDVPGHGSFVRASIRVDHDDICSISCQSVYQTETDSACAADDDVHVGVLLRTVLGSVGSGR